MVLLIVLWWMFLIWIFWKWFQLIILRRDYQKLSEHYAQEKEKSKELYALVCRMNRALLQKDKLLNELSDAAQQALDYIKGEKSHGPKKAGAITKRTQSAVDELQKIFDLEDPRRESK